MKISVSKDVEYLELSHTADGSVKQYTALESWQCLPRCSTYRYGLNFVPHPTPPRIYEVLPSGTSKCQNMTVFGDGALKGVIKVKRGHEGGPSSDWCPCKRRLGHGPL